MRYNKIKHVLTFQCLASQPVQVDILEGDFLKSLPHALL